VVKITVEFFLISPHEIDHFGPVCRELLNLGVETNFVVPKHIREVCFRILKERDLPFKTEIDPNADVSITISDHTCLYDYKKLKIKFKYGINLSKYAYNTSVVATKGFDGILVHGRYEKKLIKKLRVIPDKRICIMGYPRHDQFFREKESGEKIKQKLNIDPTNSKKILVYFPTWTEKSSIDIFYRSLINLKSKYYIITKPHHNNFYSTEKLIRWDKLKLMSDIILDTHVSFAQVASVADIIVADARSGALSEAALINNTAPIIGLHISEEPIENSYDSSIFKICKIVKNPEDFEKIAYDIQKEALCENRKIFARNLFSYIGRNCSRIAAKNIIELSKLKKISVKPQPLWLRNLKQKVKNIMASFGFF
jgi:hypothetical protein